MILMRPDIGMLTMFFKVNIFLFTNTIILFPSHLMGKEFAFPELHCTYSLAYLSLFHFVSRWCQEEDVVLLPSDRIAVLKEVHLVAGIWAGSSLLQLAIFLWRVTDKRVLLGKQEAASLSTCQAS